MAFDGSGFDEATAEDIALEIARLAARSLGVEWRDRVQQVWDRMDQRETIDAREAAARSGVANPGRRALNGLKSYDREKPTKERAADGVFEVIDAVRFDTSRVNERILMDWKARAGGAGEMFARGQIGVRELAAAVRLLELWEQSRSSQLSGMRIAERVDGGGADASGARLAGAADAAGAYRWSLAALSRTGAFLVEQRVVMQRPMEKVVTLPGAGRISAPSIKHRVAEANKLLIDALDHLADVLDVGRRS